MAPLGARWSCLCVSVRRYRCCHYSIGTHEDKVRCKVGLVHDVAIGKLVLISKIPAGVNKVLMPSRKGAPTPQALP
jgi:hypothetical protein